MLVLLMDSSCAPSDSNDNAASAAASVGASATGRDGGEDMGEDDKEIDGLTPRIQHAWSLSSELEYRPERRRRQEKSRHC